MIDLDVGFLNSPMNLVRMIDKDYDVYVQVCISLCYHAILDVDVISNWPLERYYICYESIIGRMENLVYGASNKYWCFLYQRKFENGEDV